MMEDSGRIIDLLNYEIERVKSEAEQPGWTKWALLGACGTCAYLLGSYVDANPVSWANVAAVFLLVSIGYDVGRLLWSTLESSENGTTSRLRFRHGRSLFRGTTPYCLLQLVRICALTVLARWLGMSGAYLVCLYIWHGLFGLTIIFVAVLSRLSLPFPLSAPKRSLGNSVSIVLFSGTGVAAAIGAAEDLRSQTPAVTVSDVRVAGIVFVLITLSLVLGHTSQEYYLLATLYRIRRDLLLERIDTISAAEEAEIAIMGLRLDQIFQKYVSEIVGHLNNAASSLEQYAKECKLIEAKLDKGEELGEDDDTLVQSLKQTARSHLETVHDAVQATKECVKAMMKRVHLVSGWMRNVEEELAPIRAKVLPAIDRFGEKLAQVEG
ncbi:hypothetical protein MUP05_06980, partial [Candidatus Bathyarchaeota archaeon]|nr:hypothetical protein [Candidatus Bathyarchaeota archaeon]